NMSVAVTWRVDPGPLSAFGKVTVDGNEDVPADVILNSTAFESGDTFQQHLLGRTQDWIYGLGAFRIVTVSATLDSARSRRVPVRIQVEESPRWSTEFGVGYGREEEFRAHNKSRFIGFLGEVRRLELLVRHSALEPYHVDITWLQPAFLTPRTSAALSPFVRRQTEPGFTLNRLGGDIELRHQFNRDLDASIRYVYEQVDLEEQSVAVEEISAPDLEGLYTKSSLIFGATRDNSQPLFSPNRGAQLTSTWKLSGLDLGSAYHFTSILLEGRLYREVFGVVLATRLKTGAIESFDGSGFVPVEDRFFAGGSQSIRGWARSQLGPMSGGKPLGGNGLVETSVELRFPLVWKIGGAVFMDAGNVWRQFEYVSIGELRYSPGVGLRYTTPIGPIRFDAARPVWDTESTWQFHISVGESF
ncbi:BamA/TamA family outer membrane protein, partial [candidate division GN15 bacterium]|nr:BamA/TamA family outer membrane protein [candidate division GN15 bacterium]